MRGSRVRWRQSSCGHSNCSFRASWRERDHELVFTDRVIATLMILRFRLPHAALALFYGVDRSTITRAVNEIRLLLAVRGFAVPGQPRGLHRSRSAGLPHSEAVTGRKQGESLFTARDGSDSGPGGYGFTMSVSCSSSQRRPSSVR